ncbi:uncharacterized protein [Tursiops truncatus]|uniref:uncharacterized protein n=1 Tax=Tursiops truncatus TaxID=9739 RepID=UPI003CCFD1F8
MPARPSPLRRPNPLGARACGIALRIRWSRAARTLPVPPAGARRVRATLGRGAASPPASAVPAGHSGKLLGQWRREGRQGGERRRRGPGGQQPSPPGRLATVRAGCSASSPRGGGGSRPGKGSAALASAGKKARAASAPSSAPAPQPPRVPLRPVRVHSVTPEQPRGRKGAREPVSPRRRPRGPAVVLHPARPLRPRRPRPARLLPRGQPEGGGRGSRAAPGPLRARRQPGRRYTLARVPAQRPGRRWPLERGGRGSRQVPPPRLGCCAAVAADGYGNERLCLARSV